MFPSQSTLAATMPRVMYAPADAAPAAAADAPKPTGLALYSRYAFAGAVCCAVSPYYLG